MPKPLTEADYIALARAREADDEHEFDDDPEHPPKVSIASDGSGAWVQGWYWVPSEGEWDEDDYQLCWCDHEEGAHEGGVCLDCGTIDDEDDLEWWGIGSHHAFDPAGKVFPPGTELPPGSVHSSYSQFANLPPVPGI